MSNKIKYSLAFFTFIVFWFGFHRFKLGYNPQLIEFIGSFDLVLKPTAYKLFTVADDLRWKWLKIKAALPI